MFRMLQFPEATTRDPEIDVWLTKHPDELHAIAQHWFARMRQCGSDVRELMHDGYPVACVHDAVQSPPQGHAYRRVVWFCLRLVSHRDPSRSSRRLHADLPAVGIGEQHLEVEVLPSSSTPSHPLGRSCQHAASYNGTSAHAPLAPVSLSLSNQGRSWYIKSMIQQYLCPYFWDIDTASFDPHAHPEYTIERILELGDSKAVAWLQEQFSEEQITHVIRTNKRLTPKSANYWALIYHIPAHDVTVLR